MSLTAVNGVSMETATTIWPTLEAAFPSLCFSDTCPPSPPKEATGQRRGEGHREEARLLRTGRREKKRHSQQNTKQNCQSSCSGLCVLWPDYNLCCFCAQQLLLFFWGSREHKKGSVWNCFRLDVLALPFLPYWKYLFIPAVRFSGEQQQPTTCSERASIFLFLLIIII